MVKYRFFATKGFERLGELFNLPSFTITKNMNALGMGNFTFATKTSDPFYQDLIQRKITGIEIERITQNRSEIEFKRTFNFNIGIPQFEVNGKAVTATAEGQDEFRVMNYRIVYPDPTKDPDAWAVEFDTRSGPASDVIKDYARNNFGSLALSPRQFPDITIEANNGIGDSVEENARKNNLLELAQDLALRGGDLVFGFVNLELIIRGIIDSGSSLGPGRKMIQSYMWLRADPQSNFLIGEGTGDGAARQHASASNSGSIVDFERREGAVDLRSIPATAGELEAATAAELLKTDARDGVTFVLIETPDIILFDNIDIGVQITFTDGTFSITEAIRQIIISKTAGAEEKINITAGPPEFRPDTGSNRAKQDKANSNKRLSSLERNK